LHALGRNAEASDPARSGERLVAQAKLRDPHRRADRPAHRRAAPRSAST
jgi:hypothetical protein